MFCNPSLLSVIHQNEDILIYLYNQELQRKLPLFVLKKCEQRLLSNRQRTAAMETSESQTEEL